MEIINKRTMPAMMEDSTKIISSDKEKMKGMDTIRIITEITITISMIIINTKMEAIIITIIMSMLKTLIHQYLKSSPRKTSTISMPKQKKLLKVIKLIWKNKSFQMNRMTLSTRLYYHNKKLEIFSVMMGKWK